MIEHLFLSTVMSHLRPDSEISVRYNSGMSLAEIYSGVSFKPSSDMPSLAECIEAWPDAQLKFANEAQKERRFWELSRNADPIFFKYQRGEADKSDWEAEVDRIRGNLPYYAENDAAVLAACPTADSVWDGESWISA